MKRGLVAFVAAAVAAAIAMATAAARAANAGAHAPACAGCHAEEAAQWQASGHARAAGAAFQRSWRVAGQKPECLVCHGGGRGADGEHGVDCESCHGTLAAQHPAEAKMTLPVASDACRPCHAATFGEWRLSKHGQRNIRCFDCHKMHAMKLRLDTPDGTCGGCHPSRLKDFSHATHRIKGLHCETCHMPVRAPAKGGLMDRGVRGHSFGVGVETCAGCHREMVHEGHDVVSLQEEVGRLRAGPEASVTVLQAAADAWQAAARARGRALVWLGLAGLLLGGFAGFTFGRRKR